jgi:large conductance mechanosensitive channel
MSLVSEFKTFVTRGNVMDLAVGVIVGAAFGKVVSSVVSDVVMPPIGLLVGGVNFTDIKIHLKEAALDATGKTLSPPVNLNLGNFIQAVVDFAIVAFAVFLMVKAVNHIKAKLEAEKVEAGTVPSRQEALLEEIRDLLKK